MDGIPNRLVCEGRASWLPPNGHHDRWLIGRWEARPSDATRLRLARPVVDRALLTCDARRSRREGRRLAPQRGGEGLPPRGDADDLPLLSGLLRGGPRVPLVFSG